MMRCQWWPGIRLVHRGRRDAARCSWPRAASATSSGGVPSGAIGHEEVAAERVAEGRRAAVRRDGEHRTLEERRRLDRAALAVGQRHQPACRRRNGRARSVHSSYSSRIASGVGGVDRRSLRRSDFAQSSVAVDLGRDPVRLRVDGSSYCSRPTLAQLARRRRRAAPLSRSSARVELLADRPVARSRWSLVRLEERRELVERLRRLRARFGQTLLAMTSPSTSAGTSSRA